MTFPNSDVAPTGMLRAMWTMYFAFAVGMITLSLVTFFITTSSTSSSEASPIIAVAAMFGAAVAQLALRRFGPPLKHSSESELRGTYVSRFFLRIAVAESAALIAVALVFSGMPAWTLLVGLAISGLGLWQAAPTPAALQKEQEHLNLQGCQYLLVDALKASPPATSGSSL